jgi:hypothetical protein
MGSAERICRSAGMPNRGDSSSDGTWLSSGLLGLRGGGLLCDLRSCPSCKLPGV